MVHRYKNHIIFFLITFVVVGCSTKKNTFTSRAYHNVTSRYNIYFNGREAFKAGYERIEDGFVEPYNDILPVFYYKDKNILSQAVGDMDLAIEKASKCIDKHSITAKPKQKAKATSQKHIDFYNKKEYNNWVDDSYLLMGNALFYQAKYYDAQKNFDFIISQYRKEPIAFYAKLALARTKIELEQYESAKEIVEEIKLNPDLPEKLIGDVHAVYADVLIQQKLYDDAIAMLEIAIENTKRKKIRVRYTYILAQLYQEIGDGASAIKYYKEVENMGPDYDMAFNAKISQATAFDDASGSSDDIIKLLNKLLNDEKNKEYKDQIYYALANIYYAEQSDRKALKYYLMSLQHSSSNTHQKAMSYLAIGKIYLTNKEYILAQPYFDSCMTLLPQDYRNYYELKSTSENLNALAVEHNTVVREDSLQRIAKMPEKERLKFIDKIIDKIKQAEEEQRLKEQIAIDNSTLYKNEFGLNNQKMSGKWYFYNESAVSFGKSEFIRTWGDRKLEDNWRRSNKQTMAWSDGSEDDFEDEDSIAVEEPETNNKTRQHYLKDLPLTKDLLQESTDRIEKSLFAEGMVYYNNILDNPKAIETLENFIARFPKSEYTAIALYYLHVICKEEREFFKANTYKEQVISQFPESNYAKALTNPNFFKDVREQNKQLEKNYSNCYKSYIRSEYSNVTYIADQNIKKYPDEYLTPKFAFLSAMAKGKLYGVESLNSEMKKFVEKYPNAEAIPLAKKILEFLKRANTDEVTSEYVASVIQEQEYDSGSSSQEEKELYTLDESNNVTYVIAVKSEFVDINRIKFNMINYNLDYFTNFNFTTITKELDNRTSLLFISPFSSIQQSLNYYELVNYSEEVYDGVEKTFTDHFIISQKNLNTLLSEKDVDAYMDFFYDNYIE